MALETGVTYIEDLVSTNPDGSVDTLDEADNHLRIIKTAVQGSFPSLGSSAVTKTAAQINALAPLDSPPLVTPTINGQSGYGMVIFDDPVQAYTATLTASGTLGWTDLDLTAAGAPDSSIAILRFYCETYSNSATATDISVKQQARINGSSSTGETTTVNGGGGRHELFNTEVFTCNDIQIKLDSNAIMEHNYIVDEDGDGTITMKVFLVGYYV